MNKLILGTAAAMLAAAVAPAAQAAPNLVVNGDFSQTTITTTSGGKTTTTATTSASQLSYKGYEAAGWTNSPSNGYNFIFNPNLAGSAGYTSVGDNGAIQLYTSANGGSASAPASLASPTGGNFLASDPDYQLGSISQVINGLTVGQKYQLSFYWASGQQAGFTGVTTEGWTGSLGASTFATSVNTTPSKGFDSWQQFTTTITATSTSETLKFLATGGPSGSQPPFALLDGVSLSAVPEAGTWAMMFAGFGLMGFALRRRAKIAAPAAA